MMDFSQLAVAIDAQRHGAMVVIRPHIDNPTTAALHYRMTVTQRSAGNTSNINQAGELQNGSAAGSISLSLPQGATCTVHLEVFQGAALIKAVDGACDGA
jgi:hypothetical protein